MTGFVIASIVLAMLALAILTRPWWRAPQAAPEPAPEPVLEDSTAVATPAKPAAQPAAPRTLIATLCLGCTAIAIGGYLWLGDPRALGIVGPASGNAGAGGANHEVSQEQIAAMAERLAARLEQRPDDLEGWTMLARSYAVTDQYPKAVAAFRKAAALSGNDPSVLADLADALAVTQGRSFSGEPVALIRQALAADPNNMKALSLAGTEAFMRRDFTAAIQHWEKLRSVAAPNSAFLQELDSSIDQARGLAGLPPRAAVPLGGSAATAAVPTPTIAAASASAAGPAGKAVSGVITLAPALAARAAPTDTVFVFARAVDGPRMPLAIVRRQVKDLPLRFSLDDSSAMSPATRLSAFAQVVVGARISKDGQAIAQPGDLQGLSAPVAVGSGDVQVEINQTVGQ